MSLLMLLLRRVIVGTSAGAEVEPDADADVKADADADADADVDGFTVQILQSEVLLDRSSVLVLFQRSVHPLG